MARPADAAYRFESVEAYLSAWNRQAQPPATYSSSPSERGRGEGRAETGRALAALDCPGLICKPLKKPCGELGCRSLGAGLTGIEVATEMPGKLRAALGQAKTTRPFRVILAEHQLWVGSDMGEFARPVIEEALAEQGIEARLGIEISAIGPTAMRLTSGEEIPAATVVWCAGMRANPLTQLFPVEHDRFGRMPVDEFLRVKGVAHAFAAGDVAWAMMDDGHASVMSCQHGRPMGRFAGHNVVCDLFGLPLLPLHIPCTHGQ
jgi:NADH dehydrogenase FAD-containing subunit